MNCPRCHSHVIDGPLEALVDTPDGLLAVLVRPTPTQPRRCLCGWTFTVTSSITTEVA